MLHVLVFLYFVGAYGIDWFTPNNPFAAYYRWHRTSLQVLIWTMTFFISLCYKFWFSQIPIQTCCCRPIVTFVGDLPPLSIWSRMLFTLQAEVVLRSCITYRFAGAWNYLFYFLHIKSDIEGLAIWCSRGRRMLIAGSTSWAMATAWQQLQQIRVRIGRHAADTPLLPLRVSPPPPPSPISYATSKETGWTTPSTCQASQWMVNKLEQ